MSLQETSDSNSERLNDQFKIPAYTPCSTTDCDTHSVNTAGEQSSSGSSIDLIFRKPLCSSQPCVSTCSSCDSTGWNDECSIDTLPLGFVDLPREVSECRRVRRKGRIKVHTEYFTDVSPYSYEQYRSRYNWVYYLTTISYSMRLNVLKIIVYYGSSAFVLSTSFVVAYLLNYDSIIGTVIFGVGLINLVKAIAQQNLADNIYQKVEEAKKYISSNLKCPDFKGDESDLRRVAARLYETTTKYNNHSNYETSVYRCIKSGSSMAVHNLCVNIINNVISEVLKSNDYDSSIHNATLSCMLSSTAVARYGPSSEYFAAGTDERADGYWVSPFEGRDINVSNLKVEFLLVPHLAAILALINMVYGAGIVCAVIYSDPRKLILLLTGVWLCLILLVLIVPWILHRSGKDIIVLC